MTPEQLSDKAIDYWRNEARRLYATRETYRADIERWRNKYYRAVRIMRRFQWATVILGALLGFAVLALVMGAK